MRPPEVLFGGPRGAEERALADEARAVLARTAAATPGMRDPRAGETQALERALRACADEQLARLRHPRPDDDLPPAEVGALVADLQEAYLRLREHRLRREIERHQRVLEGLEALRTVGSSEQLLERVPRQLCASGGFERAVLSRVQDSEWILAGAHFTGDEAWANTFVEFGAHTRPTLAPGLLETHMVRRRTSALVTDAPNDPRTHKPFVAHSRTQCYVSTPIMPRGNVVGFFHADHRFSGRPVDELDRETLWAFTAGFAFVYERVVLLERLHRQRERVQDVVASTAAVVDNLADGAVGMEWSRRTQTVGRREMLTRDRDDLDSTLLLTERELEVLSLMAAGATNAAIARELFIAEGTVKSHVKRILRKLDATNRAEAVSRFLSARLRDPAAAR